ALSAFRRRGRPIRSAATSPTCAARSPHAHGRATTTTPNHPGGARSPPPTRGDTTMGAEHPCPWCGYPGPHQRIPISYSPDITPEERQRWGTHRVRCGRCLVPEVWDPPDPPGDGVTTLDLRLVPPQARDWARRDLEAGTALGLLCTVESHQAWTFVVANHR